MYRDEPGWKRVGKPFFNILLGVRRVLRLASTVRRTFGERWKMKIKYLAAIAFLVATLQGCGSPSDTELVKNGIMQFNKTLTVGEAFDRWSECQSRKWEEFKSDNGQRVVQFTCSAKNVTAFMNKAKSILTNESKYDHFNLTEVVETFQWTINKDDTFQLQHVGTTWKWADGKTKEVDGNAQMLKSVYSNENTFDMSAFKDPESLEAVKTARAYADMAYMLYDSAK